MNTDKTDDLVSYSRPCEKIGHTIWEKVKIYANMSAIPIFLLILWQVMSNAGFLLDIILPSPVKVARALREIILNGTLYKDIKTSLVRVLIGYFWGSAVGVSAGIACGVSKIVERFITPLVTTIRQIPLYAWMPLIILWFGIGEMSKRVIIAEMVFVPVFVNTLHGVRNVSNDYIEVARVLELKYGKLLRKVVFPSALPSIFTGLRLGSGSAWMAVVASEMLGGLTGLGYGLLKAREFLRSDTLIALMAVVGLIGLSCDRLINVIADSVLQWQKGFKGAMNDTGKK
jgi:sulfonate transport system permease protein